MISIITMKTIPENCYDCPCENHESGTCQADEERRSTQVYRPFWCPLKEIKTTQDLCCENRNEVDEYKSLYGFYDR